MDFLMKFCKASILLLTAGVSLSSGAGSAMAQIPTNCKALVELGDELWLYTADATPIAQLTFDRTLKHSAAITNDGKVIAYTRDASPFNPTLIDSAGRHLASVNVNAKDVTTGLRWIFNGMLRVEEHAHPAMSVYHFLKLE